MACGHIEFHIYSRRLLKTYLLVLLFRSSLSGNNLPIPVLIGGDYTTLGKGKHLKKEVVAEGIENPVH